METSCLEALTSADAGEDRWRAMCDSQQECAAFRNCILAAASRASCTIDQLKELTQQDFAGLVKADEFCKASPEPPAAECTASVQQELNSKCATES